MRKSNGSTWGVLLLVLGVLWLLQKMDLLNFDWYIFTRYWAVLLVISGVLLIFSGKKYPNPLSSFAGALVILAIIGGLVNKSHKTTQLLKDNWNWEERDTTYEPNEKSQLYDFKMDPVIERGELNLKDGAGSYTISESTDKLFENYTKSRGFAFNVRTNKLEKEAIVDLSREDIANLDDIGKSEIKLNTKPLWNLNMEIGAGKANFDLSKFKIEKLTVQAGVGELKIKLGNQHRSTDINIESGVASIKMEIPRAVGCEIVLEDGMNARNFDDFTKINDGVYRSTGYETSSKKIRLHFNSGLSKIRVKRY